MNFLDYDFFVYALLAGLIASVLCAVIGNFIVAGRQSMLSDMLAHTALAGVGLGIFFHVSPSMTSIFVLIISSTLLWWLLEKRQFSQDSVSILLMTNGLAIALLFSHLAKNNPVSFESFLFGNILTVSPQEIWILLGVSIFVLGFLFLFWKQFLSVIFDYDFSKIRWKNSKFVELAFMICVAVTVGLSLKIIGGLLIGALLVIPVLIAKEWSTTFKQTVFVSVIASVFGVSIGIFISLFFDIPTSSSIVLTLTALFLASRGMQTVKYLH